ncbi:hypothetical protein L211DRAFT_860247 [Terfezia boudieri ATCC MYA-4762]|uniref:ER lumen protein retaining receptor n=1 Tax=Terfezia boudieri ATCC MYA-4762 TaxID=1051890 RepID=A0A3N4M7V3_9PEZI|nr:hypothetical protein L211DRAFT_860247 [Terfezia boudieri ATCC MYA-4762]
MEVFENKNFFRIAADFTHLSSKLILITTIHRLRSAEGISFLTQILYLLVFCLRYLDLFWTFTFDWYNTTLKIFYILTSLYTLYIMLKRFSRSREGEKEWRVTGWILVIGVVVGFFGGLIILWNISYPIEALHLLPQLSLLSHISTPTVINSYYLLALGSYRFLYILNWIERRIQTGWFDPLPAIAAVVQTYMYLEFAWVYWRRQRVKLRSGGVLDHEDWVTGGLLLRWVFGSHEGEGASKGTTGGSWRDWARDRFGASRGVRRPGGRGGVSVSADEGGIGEILARGPRGGSDDEDDNTIVWQHGGAVNDEEGIVLAGSDDDDDDDDDDENRMTTNEIRDRRGD